jgi:hypothetical protein
LSPLSTVFFNVTGFLWSAPRVISEAVAKHGLHISQESYPERETPLSVDIAAADKIILSDAPVSKPKAFGLNDLNTAGRKFPRR